MNIEKKYNLYKKQVDKKINFFLDERFPASLYQPVKYIMESGGKRIRPIILLFSCEAVGGNYKNALNAAAAVEILHNFTLIHDDIMDNALKRRGRDTVHNKWDVNTAILSGDGLIGYAYKFLLNTKSGRIVEIIHHFNRAIIEVCEGQSYDKEYEIKTDVSIDEYILMIKKKTSKLIEISCVIGGLIGNADEKQIRILKNYSSNIGIAFQILDDLLDIDSDEKLFGKKTGGDIIERKKTYLAVKALEVVKNGKERKLLNSVFVNKSVKIVTPDIIEQIKVIYQKNGVLDLARKEIRKYTDIAEYNLAKLTNENGVEMLKWFSQMLLSRNY